MRCSRIAILLAFCFVLAAVSFGQAVKLDEFRQVDDAELKTHVYSLFNRLNHDPDARGYVIVYSAGDANALIVGGTPMIDRIRQIIARSPYYDALITVSDGGPRKAEAAEIYIFSKGAASPGQAAKAGRCSGKPIMLTTRRFREEDGILEEYVNRAVLYRLDAENLDEPDGSGITESTEYNGPAFIESESSEPQIAEPATDVPPEPDQMIESPSAVAESPAFEQEPSPELTAEELEEKRFDWIEKDFAPEIKKRPGARGLMILYADDQFYDIARLQTFVEQGRDRIAERAEIDPSLIEVIFGGYRGQAQIEYYIVPDGGNAPEPRPEER